MNFKEGYIYHVFNRGNNKQQIFFSEKDYRLFIHYINQFIGPYSDMLAWCLMPNHFHFLIHATNKSIETRKSGGLQLSNLSYGIKQLLSSYTKSINKRENRTGNLFQQKTKAKCVNDSNGNHSRNAFFYIHQNPLKANLVSRIEEWQYSSFSAITKPHEDSLIDVSLVKKYIDFNEGAFMEDVYNILTEEEAQLII
jgi:REP element-mobilizing transposase RayT